MQLEPIMLGLLAGITVLLGALPLSFIRRDNKKLLGSLSALAGGVLSYIAMDTGSSAEEIIQQYARIQTLDSFILYTITTAISFLLVLLLLTGIEKRLKVKRNDAVGSAQLTSFSSLTAAVALGVHNVGEGFAIAAALIANQVVSALLFTIGFGIHNATEGFAIVAPMDKRTFASVGSLSLIAGLPTMLGASVYYFGILNDLFLANLYSIATAAIVYALLKINLSAASKLGGFNYTFWFFLFLGVAIALGTESVINIAMG
jgi:ZIP family zinc transporter